MQSFCSVTEFHQTIELLHLYNYFQYAVFLCLFNEYSDKCNNMIHFSEFPFVRLKLVFLYNKYSIYCMELVESTVKCGIKRKITNYY